MAKSEERESQLAQRTECFVWFPTSLARGRLPRQGAPLLHPSSRGVSLVRGHLSRIPCQGEPLPDPSSGGVSKCFVLSSKSVRGTQTVHLKKTNSDFLIPMILYFPVHKAVLNFYLKPLSIIKVCNSENIVVNCRYYRFWNCL